MISKSFSKTGTRCQVTFKLEINGTLSAASVVGDFNDWTPGALTMKPLKSGHLSASISLPSNQKFAYKFLTSNGEWVNDEAADDYTANEWGETNSLVDTKGIDAPAAKPAKKAAKKTAAKKVTKKKTVAKKAPAKKKVAKKTTATKAKAAKKKD